ncbi:hypothetical protein C8J56DRAFT_879629 [Mycena floridula]|nr:hypothetical protein C8J56DRAFT_879629 [Mycena floridula]
MSQRLFIRSLGRVEGRSEKQVDPPNKTKSFLVFCHRSVELGRLKTAQACLDRCCAELFFGDGREIVTVKRKAIQFNPVLLHVFVKSPQLASWLSSHRPMASSFGKHNFQLQYGGQKRTKQKGKATAISRREKWTYDGSVFIVAFYSLALLESRGEQPDDSEVEEETSRQSNIIQKRKKSQFLPAVMNLKMMQPGYYKHFLKIMSAGKLLFPTRKLALDPPYKALCANVLAA